MMDDVLQTDNDLGLWKNFEPRRPPGSSTIHDGIPSVVVSGGKLTFRVFFELACDCEGELSSDIPNKEL